MYNIRMSFKQKSQDSVVNLRILHTTQEFFFHTAKS